MVLKNMSGEQQREALHKTIWKIAEDLRGSVDGWDFKQYVLGFLFYRFISENITNYLNKKARDSGEENFDYSVIEDEMAEKARQTTIEEKGFYILPSELFKNTRAKAKTDPDLNETLERVFKNIENSAMGFDSENNFKGLFDDIDVNNKKLGETVRERNESLEKILDSIGKLNFEDEFQNNSIDAFGDAYEFLMTMYASEAGKSGGEFYTPQEVAELLAKITIIGKSEISKVYDPACGSGSLLLKFAKILGKDNVRQGFFGQEINITSYNLCRINMFLHDINFEKFNIKRGDTLVNPLHGEDGPFEAIVSNPPYSTRWAGDDNPSLIHDRRFSPAGVLAPKSKSDLAFVMHILNWLATDGTAAIVEFPGVLFRQGGEKKIRKYLIDNNYIDAVIGLPSNLFFGVGIAVCVLVLKKSKNDNVTLFIDASKESVRSNNKEKLKDENIEKILNAYREHTDKDRFSRLVSNGEIAGNDYDLSISSYIKNEDAKEMIDIKKLNAEIAEIVKRQDTTRKAIDEIVNHLEIKSLSKNQLTELKPTMPRTVNLGDLCLFKIGTRLTRKEFRPGDVPVLCGGREPTGTHDTANRTGETIAIVNYGTAGHVSYWNRPVWVADSAFSVDIKDDVPLLPKYLFYCLQDIQEKIAGLQRGACIPSVNKSALAKLSIPPPPYRKTTGDR